MSMVTCEKCDVAIDTDFNCEVFREDDKVVCDQCFDKLEGDDDEHISKATDSTD